MKNNLSLKNFIHRKHLEKNSVKAFTKKYSKILVETRKDIFKPKKTLNVLNKKYFSNFKFGELRKLKKFKTIVLIGMGGSILGSEAIYSFLNKKIKKKLYFFDDLNESNIMFYKKKEKLSNTLFIIISKSGNTVETLSNTFSLDLFKRRQKNIIIISEKKNNLLFNLAKKFNLFYIEHKNYIGGRYSVLSEVGVIPAYLMGINIRRLRLEIADIFKIKNQKFLKDSTIKLASLMKKNKINNLIFLNYSPELEKFLYWLQQLIAESLGKNNKGFLPVISSAPKDHHSLLQLYLDGPKDKIFNIFSLEQKSNIKIKVENKINSKNILNNYFLNKIKNTQKKALINIFIKKKIPFREFKIKTRDEKVLGKLFSYFMLETIIIGKLLNINPFDQPAVEQVKIETKKILLKKLSKNNF